MPYTINQLKKLRDLENHLIKFDGYDYWWYSKRNYDYELHYINPFSDYLTAKAYIYYWVEKYNTIVKNYQIRNHKLIDNIMNDVRIYDIVKSDLKTIDKVISILDIKPNLNQTEIAEYLNISKMAINKHIKKIKKYV